MYCKSLADNPCTARCTNLRNPQDERCKGCGRTREQINTWSSLSEIDRKLIVIDNWDLFTPKQKLESLLDQRDEINAEIRRED